MCEYILKSIPGFQYAHSKFGMGEVDDGYCYVLFDASKFNKTEEMTETTTHHQRFVGLTLFHKESQKYVFVASLHLPANGSAPVGSIQTKIKKLNWHFNGLFR